VRRRRDTRPCLTASAPSPSARAAERARRAGAQVRLMILAALAGEHLLLLGPPGTAKSELSRRLARLTGGLYFERLLTRFSVPEELFGPLSMKGAPWPAPGPRSTPTVSPRLAGPGARGRMLCALPACVLCSQTRQQRASSKETG